ncbi:fimbrial protein [Providencia rettgeri]|uniref:fimbrial protein n=1 Tax=Providencia TaxID=586 RepID=UPI00206DAA10|nr:MULTISPECIES: fimbrial protein [unclassified Providencia]UNJ80068.1 putative mannose-resistant/Proteus-like fimbrial protein [Providencia sp.]UNJ80150.1 putative mannose-resistant/Proteus-like fimbrial protein [Providencia sp.]
MKKVIIGVCVSGMISSSALAVDQGHGKVTFKGEIIDAPCSISADSVDQTVELGQISNSILANGGASSPKQFTIELEDCVFPNNAGVKYNDKVKITFSGASAKFNPKLLGVTGLISNDDSVGNVGIQITDTQGMPIDMGVSTSQDHQLQEGSNTLQYSAFMRGANVAVDEIPLGKFEGITNFTLAYN